MVKVYIFNLLDYVTFLHLKGNIVKSFYVYIIQVCFVSYYRDPNTRAGGIEEQGGKMYEI